MFCRVVDIIDGKAIRGDNFPDFSLGLAMSSFISEKSFLDHY